MANSSTLRPFNGKSVSSLPDTVAPVIDVSVSSAEALALTSTSTFES